MALAPGTRLGPYEIQAIAGIGGMGEVYKARDSRLGRTVALKILPAEVASDPERRRRFEQEARAASALDHPYISVLHDIGSDRPSSATGVTQPGAPPVDYLVLEYLEGQTLADRLERKGRLPLDQVLEYGTQMAEALAAAHHRGIVHRDFKPANVMLTKSGVKLMDFGLARLSEPDPGLAATTVASAPGMVVGTVPYMAPEQLQGRPTDARTDVFACGAVIYEMLTGRRAFEGDSPASVMAAILEHDPPTIGALAPGTPPLLDHLVRRCLAKSPDDRWDSAHDVADELRWLREGGAVGAMAGMRARRGWWQRIAPSAIVGFIAALIGAGIMWLVGPSRAPGGAVTRAWLDVGPAESLNSGASSPQTTTPAGSRTALAWTPDGRTLVFIGRRAGTEQLYLRQLDRGEASPLKGTEGAGALAVSPDGQWVAFWAGGALKKMLLAGGPVVEIVGNLPYAPSALAWDRRLNLYFSRPGEGRIYRAAPVGGLDVVSLNDDYVPGTGRHTLPSVLPNGNLLLYTLRKRPHIGWGDEEIVAQVLATGERKTLLKDAADARYVPTGHLVFMRRGRLFGVAFDPDRVETRGPVVPLVDEVVQSLVGGIDVDCTGAGQFAVASTGTLAWVAGPLQTYPERALVWVDRHGVVSPTGAPPRSYGIGVRLSSDLRRAAVGIQTLAGERAWVYDFARETLSLVNPDADASSEKWSQNGRRVVFRMLEKGRYSLARQRADGAGPVETLAPGGLVPSSWTPDGRQLVGVLNGDLAVATFADKGQVRIEVLARTPAVEGWPEFSPDGRWLAYASDVSGEEEVRVQPYPGPGPIALVGSGRCPAWRGDGRELFFLSLRDQGWRRRMMAVDFEAGSPPRIGRPRALFDFDARELALSSVVARPYDVTPDGQRFLAVRTPPSSIGAPPVTHVNIAFNWFEELKAKVPGR